MVGRHLALAAALIASSTMPAVAGPRVAVTAEEPSLTWRAPASCPDVESLRARVEQRLERSLDGIAVPIEIDVSRAAGRYLAKVDLRAMTVANDVRTLTSKRCSELADAVAVIVARVASDAIAARSTTPAATTTEVAVRDEDDTVDEPIIVASRISLTPKPRRWALGVRISGLSGIGVIPKVGLGGEVAVSLRRHSHLVELGGARWATSAAQFHDGAPAKVDVDLDVAIARFGWRPAAMPLRGWVAIESGVMKGAGVRLPSEQLDSGRWLAAGAGFGIAWPMTSWARLVGMTETMLAIERVRFSLGDIVVYAPSPMSFRATCGLEVGWQ